MIQVRKPSIKVRALGEGAFLTTLFKGGGIKPVYEISDLGLFSIQKGDPG